MVRVLLTIAVRCHCSCHGNRCRRLESSQLQAERDTEEVSYVLISVVSIAA